MCETFYTLSFLYVINRFLDSMGHNKGVYSIEGEVKEWLKAKLIS
jgi:hypothetical protein